jgi:Rnl2 family RNA ligase
MLHQSYSSIENYYNEEYVNKIRKLYSKDLFIAQEKIHGSNFSFQISYDPMNPDYKKIYCSSRTQRIGILTETDGPDFFGTKNIIMNKYEDLCKIKNELFAMIPGVEKAQIYGELFGGTYKDIFVKTAKPIQKGIYYNSDNDFIVFDIRVQTYEKDDYYLSQEEISELLKDTNIKQVKIMYKGTLDELLQLNPTFESTIYSYYNLPKIDNNIAEGYVIKKDGQILLANKDKKLGELINPIIKLKSPAFAEISNLKTPIEKDLMNKVLYIQNNYINENRINAYKSKFIDSDKKTIICGVIDDAIEEYLKLNTEDSNLKKTLTDKVRKAASGKIIRYL